jgi:outer-membrane receptor for ferric coprogen and ferric-rhodotorulic acid
MRSRLTCTLAVLAAGTSAAPNAQEVTADDTMDTIIITAKRADRISKGATGLNLEIRETPQSISVVTSEQMENFGADNLNDALRLATGINVEEWETNRTNYMARGFDIKNTQIDGIGLPNNWGIVTGAMDAFGYEKIEVIRGANGLLTGVGNSAGTINYVRKRPTNDTQGSIAVEGGSYDRMRVQADYSTPFTESGSWAGRLVVAAEDEESWLRGMKNDRAFVYGVVDGQIGEKSTLTVGYSYQDANTDGNMWGALVLAYTDGTQAEFSRGASTSQDWAFWDTTNQNGFIEYTYALSDSWDVKLNYNYRDYEDDSKLFFAYSMEGIDRETGLGLLGNPGSWPTKDRGHLLDLAISGEFDFFGRSHEAIFGVSRGTGKETQYWRPVDENDPSWGALPAFPYAGNAVAEPVWGPTEEYSIVDQTLERVYGAARLSMTDKLTAIVGINWADYHRDGHQQGALFDQTERELSPYGGVTYEVVDNVLLYASYSDIYQPQDYYDLNEEYLDPSKGVNYELGVKADWLDQRVLTTLAWFTAEQEGLGTFAGMNENGNYYYEGVDIDSEGYELEVVGRLNDYVDLVLGFTLLELKGQQNEDIYEWVPRETINLALSTKVPGLTSVALGINGRWQSDISKVDEYTGVRVRQDSYAHLNTFARWDVTNQMTVRANVNNLTDEKYITSLYQIGFYGAPRNYSVSFAYRFGPTP